MRSKARIIIVRKATSSRLEGCLNLEMLEIRHLEQETVVIQVNIRWSSPGILEKEVVWGDSVKNL